MDSFFYTMQTQGDTGEVFAYEKEYPDREFKYTPYRDLKKEEQKLDMIAVYKHFSADRGHYEDKRDYSDTINKIIARQEKLFG